MGAFYQRLAATKPSDLPRACGRLTLRVTEEAGSSHEEQWAVCNALGAGTVGRGGQGSHNEHWAGSIALR